MRFSENSLLTITHFDFISLIKFSNKINLNEAMLFPELVFDSRIAIPVQLCRQVKILYYITIYTHKGNNDKL